MKVAYVCVLGHVTIIEKKDTVSGHMPSSIQCTHLYCGCASTLHEASVLDEAAHATHEFYNALSTGLLTTEEIDYLKSGFLMFREIPEAISREVKNEFRHTEEIVKLAEYLADLVPPEGRTGSVVSTAINIIDSYKKDAEDITGYLIEKGMLQKGQTISLPETVLGILKAYV
jgi:hypothetical protein